MERADGTRDPHDDDENSTPRDFENKLAIDAIVGDAGRMRLMVGTGSDPSWVNPKFAEKVFGHDMIKVARPGGTQTRISTLAGETVVHRYLEVPVTIQTSPLPEVKPFTATVRFWLMDSAEEEHLPDLILGMDAKREFPIDIVVTSQDVESPGWTLASTAPAEETGESLARTGEMVQEGERLVGQISAQPGLYHPQAGKPMILTADASQTAIAWQEQLVNGEKVQVPLVYGGRRFKDAEKHWCSLEKEFIAAAEGRGERPARRTKE